jgi:hypothetical protein
MAVEPRESIPLLPTHRCRIHEPMDERQHLPTIPLSLLDYVVGSTALQLPESPTDPPPGLPVD